MSPSEEGIRLAKRVAAEQNCSRREAEALIEAGGVQVNGQVVTDPARRVRPEQALQGNRMVSMAALQNSSRSQAEAWITAGAVQVDGRVVTDPARRVHAENVNLFPRQRLAPTQARWTVLAYVQTPNTWPDPKPEGEGPTLPGNLRKHAPLFPLPSGPV